MISASVTPLARFHQRDHFGLFVGAIRRRSAGRLLGPNRFLYELGFLGGGGVLGLRLRHVGRRKRSFPIQSWCSFRLT
jgi:hypothetical protein